MTWNPAWMCQLPGCPQEGQLISWPAWFYALLFDLSGTQGVRLPSCLCKEHRDIIAAVLRNASALRSLP